MTAVMEKQEKEKNLKLNQGYYFKKRECVDTKKMVHKEGA